jgi:uncharacterized membrane protein YvbJ
VGILIAHTTSVTLNNDTIHRTKQKNYVVNCVHSMIEKNIKRALKSGPIYTPSQYVTLVRTAKKTGKPFNAIEMSHDDHFDLKNLTESTFNFNKNDMEENKFSEVSIFKVEKENLDCFFFLIKLLLMTTSN